MKYQHILWLVAVCIIAVCLCLGCVVASVVAWMYMQPAPPVNGNARLSQADNGLSRDVTLGKQIDVVLPSNPSTGFQWTVDQVDSSMLQPLGEPDYQSESLNPAPGTGGYETFHFSAIAPGTTTLRLIYHRTFEEGVAPLETFEVTIHVK